MYLKYWKLVCRPFDERAGSSWFFPSSQHQGMLVKLRCLVKQHKPIAALAGGSGYGKSMVAATFADGLSPETHWICRLGAMPNTAEEVLAAIRDEEGAEQQGRRAETGQQGVALLDGVGLLPEKEFQRLVRALRTAVSVDAPSVTTILIGSPELLVWARRLARSSEELFPQCLLDAMAPPDTAAYISHRLRLAGGGPDLFTPDAVELVHDLSGGVPRRINRLCDLSLLAGFARDCDRIDDSLVWAAQSEVRVLAPTRTATARPTRRWKRLCHRENLPIAH